MEPIQNIQTGATWFRHDNTTQSISPANGVQFTRAELRKLVDGDYVYWTLANGKRIVAREDTMMDTAPRNEPLYFRIGVPVVGVAVVAPAHMIPDFKH